MKVMVFKQTNTSSVGISGMYPDDFEAFVKLLEGSGIPQFEAVAQCIKDKEVENRDA